MIQLQRDRARIPPSFRDPARQARLLELFRAKRDGQLGDATIKKKLFSSSRWNATKPQLQRETSGKCAFCETPTSAAYYGDVEHFRPKALYWWLAYCYDNYLYSCRVCNGKKSDQYEHGGPPLAEPAVDPAADDAALALLAAAACPEPGDAVAIGQLLALLDAEGPGLPNPYRIDPEILFQWAADDVIQEVRAEARPGLPAAASALATAERMVDINREELRIWRWRTYDFARRLRDIAASATGQARLDTIDTLRTMAAPTQPFSAMVRYFAGEEWGLI
ncbi:hypothetical protein [Sphingosinicella sp. CPCC 101087]|uniref:hypothetical protein n=1 Tax=Sphingosinicella sp. CPCC 101087 TaxID=2497754 RepID=UPI00101D8CF6|nr:hypothetical protein [Sphingosinicella sp. CPCC 101087]